MRPFHWSGKREIESWLKRTFSNEQTWHRQRCWGLDKRYLLALDHNKKIDKGNLFWQYIAKYILLETVTNMLLFVVLTLHLFRRI